MVGTCVGAGLEARARRVTLVPVCWRRSFLRRSDSELRFREDRSLVFYTCRRSCRCGIRLFLRDRPSLRLYGCICDTVFRLPGMGTGDSSAACQPVEGCYRIGRRMDAAAASASARLAILSCRRFYGYWSAIAGHRFHLTAAKSTRFDDFRLKS